MDKSFLAKFMFYFGVSMIAVYFIMGIGLIFFPVLRHIPQNIKVVFGIFFLVYGVFRLTRLVLKLKEQKKYEK